MKFFICKRSGISGQVFLSIRGKLDYLSVRSNPLPGEPIYRVDSKHH